MQRQSTQWPLLIATLFFLSQVFIFNPIALYFTNVDEMHIVFWDLIKLASLPVFFALLIALLVTKVINNKGKLIVAAILSMLSILVWLQSSIFLWDYGLLDGRLIHWDQAQWRGIVDGAVWLIGIFIVMRASAPWREKIITLAALVFILQLITSVYLIATHIDALKKQRMGSDQLQQIYQFSAKQNVLHLMVDGFQSDIFNDLIQVPQLGEYYKTAMQGFTYYPETLGVFPYTRFAIPAFLGAQVYNNSLPQDVFVDKVLSGKNIINAANANGFSVDLVMGGPWLEKRYTHLQHQNQFNIDNMNSILFDAAQVLDMALFRAVPHFIKPLIYNQQKWLLSPMFATSESLQYNYFKHTVFLKEFIQNMKVGRNEPTYKYIHIMNTHNPMVVNADCSYSGHVSGMDREALTYQTKCTMDTVISVLDKLKQLGIYDKTLIIIHGDHGGWVGNRRDGSEIKFWDGTEAEPWLASLASPMLAIKYPSQKGELKISTQLVSLLDLPDTISAAMKWHENFGQQSLLTMDNSVERERSFYFYNWKDSGWDKKYASPIQQFIIEGSHYDTEWKLGEVYLPKK